MYSYLAHTVIERGIKASPPKKLEGVLVIQMYLFAVEGEQKKSKPATFPVLSQQRTEGLVRVP